MDVSNNVIGGGNASLPSTFPNARREVTTIKENSAAPVVAPVQNEELKNDDQAVKDLQKTIDAIQGPQKSIEISVHKETNAIMIKIKNKDTGELIREIPPEKVLDAVAKLMEQSGLIVDKKI